MSSHENKPAEETQDAATEGQEEAPQKKGKGKLIIILAAVLVLGGGAAAFLTMGGDAAKKEEAAKKAAESAKKKKKKIALPVYYELPQILVNLNAGSTHVSFLKMSVTLELKDKASVAVVDANKPRILDAFNTYIREMRPADVQGSAGLFRLRDELMARINGTVQEGLVKDILFSEIQVQ